MPRPKLSAAPTDEELAAVSCPADRFALVSRFAHDAGTLPSRLVRRRLTDLLAALTLPGITQAEIAGRSDMSKGRISQLAKIAQTRFPEGVTS